MTALEPLAVVRALVQVLGEQGVTRLRIDQDAAERAVRDLIVAVGGEVLAPAPEGYQHVRARPEGPLDRWAIRALLDELEPATVPTRPQQRRPRRRSDA